MLIVSLGLVQSFWFEICFDIPKRIAKPIQKDPDLKKKRFIVIDNDGFDRAFLEHQLNEWGGDVAACSNSDEAIAVMCALFAKGMTVEGIFIDDETNHANAIDLHALMKNDDVLSDIPLFIMVSSIDNVKVKESLVNEYIVKPLDILSFKAIICHAYSDKSTEQLVEENVLELADLSSNDVTHVDTHGLKAILANNSDTAKN